MIIRDKNYSLWRKKLPKISGDRSLPSSSCLCKASSLTALLSLTVAWKDILCLFKVLLIKLMTFTQHLLSKSHSSTCSKDTETHRPWHGFSFNKDECPLIAVLYGSPGCLTCPSGPSSQKNLSSIYPRLSSCLSHLARSRVCSIVSDSL